MNNDFATTALWSDAVADHDAEARRELVVRAKVAVSGTWPFLAAAQSEEEFEHRLALMLPQIEAKATPDVLDDVVAGLRADYATLAADTAHEESQARTAALSVEAAEGDTIPTPFVHVYNHKDRVLVDHVAGPSYLQTIHRGRDENEAMQAAREFALPNGMPIYHNGKKVESARLAAVAASLGPDPVEFLDTATGQWIRPEAVLVPGVPNDGGLMQSFTSRTADIANSEFFNVASGRWEREVPFTRAAAKGGMTYHESYGEVSKPQLAAYRKHNVPPALHDELAGYFGSENHDAITNYVNQAGPHQYGPDAYERGLGYGSVYRHQPGASGHMSELEEGGGGWGRVSSQRQALFTPDPSDAQRYNRYPTQPQPNQGGNPGAAHPIAPPQVGPDGFPVDLAVGEQRSPEAYARQTTPGVWAVTPGTEWRDDTVPNAATGLPRGQTVNGTAATASAILRAQHKQAVEGIVPTPGPNPNYFSQGNQGLQGPPTFPENPSSAIEPKTDNHMDDIYGGVPPMVSGGSSQGQTDGQGYSRGESGGQVEASRGRLPFEAGLRAVPVGEGLSGYPSRGEYGRGVADRVGQCAECGKMTTGRSRTPESPNGFPHCLDHESIESQHRAYDTMTGNWDEGHRGDEGDHYGARKTANQYIKQQGGKWVITQKGTGKVLSHHDSEEEAEASFRAMMQSKHGSKFNEGHTEQYIGWAKSQGHDPDNVATLKRYEKQPGVGRAHTNYIADQLYIGGGDSDWRSANEGHWDTGGEYRSPGVQMKPRTAANYVNQPEPKPGSTMPCPECGGYGVRESVDDHERQMGIHDACYHCNATGRVDAHAEWENNEYSRGHEHGSLGIAPEHDTSPAYLEGHARGHEENRFYHHPDNYRVKRDGQDDYRSPAAQERDQADVDSGNYPEPWDEDHPYRHASRTAATNGRIVGVCDHCEKPVRYHDEDGGHLRHLHNGAAKCADGKIATAVRYPWGPYEARFKVGHVEPDPMRVWKRNNVSWTPQFFDPKDPGVVTLSSLDLAAPAVQDGNGALNKKDGGEGEEDGGGMGAQSSRRTSSGESLERPSPENPTGRGSDEFRARTWDSLIKQRPMQSPEDRNINTPTQSEEQLTPNNRINTPYPGTVLDGRGSVRDEDDINQNENSRET